MSEKFERDLRVLMSRLCKDSDQKTKDELGRLFERLVELREHNLLKINHSVLEMVVAKNLIQQGHDDVLIEHDIDGITCDVCAVKDGEIVIVEVETGYVPPKHALDPVDYIIARIASKIARYSNHCDRFILGAPPHYVMPIPECLAVDHRFRSSRDIESVKRYCDMYYSSPPVSMEEIEGARIDSVHIIEVENLRIKEQDAMSYIKRAAYWYR